MAVRGGTAADEKSATGETHTTEGIALKIGTTVSQVIAAEGLTVAAEEVLTFARFAEEFL